MSHYQLLTEQKIPASIEDVWNFISSPANLKEITPDHMGFDITSKNLPEKMYPGMIIMVGSITQKLNQIFVPLTISFLPGGPGKVSTLRPSSAKSLLSCPLAQ